MRTLQDEKQRWDDLNAAFEQAVEEDNYEVAERIVWLMTALADQIKAMVDEELTRRQDTR